MLSMQLGQITSTKIAAADQNQLFQMISGLFKVKPEDPLLHTPRCYVSPRVLITTLQLKLRKSGTILRKQTKHPCLCWSRWTLSSVSSTFSNFTQVPISYIRELITKSKPKACVWESIPHYYSETGSKSACRSID